MAPNEPMKQKLEDQAATAALYVTKGKGGKGKEESSNYPLDKNGKLSSAGAATSLKHAKPKDLPSFPSAGLANADSSAGAAASLANANKKDFEYWKPGELPAANKAAMLAKDYKAEPLWQPELSAAGSKAALLADRKGGDVKIWRPEETDAGHSAAEQAMRMKGLSPQLDRGYTKDGEKRALMAATQSMASGRRRAGSTPTVANPEYPDSGNAAANALKAATSVSRGGRPQPEAPTPARPQLDAARIHNQAITNMKREMYTSNPPVAPEVEEKNRQTTLRASAVAMAKQMYNVQQRQIEEAAALRQTSDSQHAAVSMHNRPASSISSDDGKQAPQYANLQEAAQKLAAERLAKLHDEHASYRNYYGAQAPQSRKLSIRGRVRRRASSDGEIGDNDEDRARQIRTQMSLFTGKLDQVDSKKRQKDRESLLAVAQKNVRASMLGMDQKVFNETGKSSPAMMEEWEAKARAKAQAESETRMVNHGRINIGGGKYIDQSEIDAIAAAKVQPTLDEITETAEKHRARDEELRQQQLERERIAAEKNMDDKTRANQTKEEWKRFKEEEKREARARKEAEKTKRAEEKRLRDEEKRKSKEAKATSKVPVVPVIPVVETKETTVEPALEPAPEPAVQAEEEEGMEEGEEEEEEEEEEEGEEAKEEEDAQQAAIEREPPILAAIPHVSSIPIDAKETIPPDDEERIDPAFIPISTMSPINASQADFPIDAGEHSNEPTFTEDDTNRLEPYITADTAEEPVIGSEAEEIARRVFSSPVVDETSAADTKDAAPADLKEAADTSADTGVAPVVSADTTTGPPLTATGSTSASKEPVSAAADSTFLPTTKSTTATSKPDAPVSNRVALPAVAAAPAPTATLPPPTTETTVSAGPSKLTKEKDSGKVSSWLKTKFSRRSSKALKSGDAPASSETATTTATTEKPRNPVAVTGPAGTTVLTEASGANSSDLGDSSMRDVALAGKGDSTTAPAMVSTATGTPPVVSPLKDDETAAHETTAPTSTGANRESSEISSLSSDEDTRGRSAIRLADSMGLPVNEPHTSEAHQQPTNKRAGMIVPDMPASVTGGKSSTSGGRTSDFEEANDTFEHDGKLSPPPSVLPGAEAEGRKSGGSPARDSKFVEVL